MTSTDASRSVPEPSENDSWRKYFHHLKWQQMAAGVTGGVVTTAILHPLDLAKIRLQVNEGNKRVKSR